jgi:hypothetical protein
MRQRGSVNQQLTPDPDDEEHADRLDWLGLDSPSQFDPAAFSLDEINDRLRRLG